MGRQNIAEIKKILRTPLKDKLGCGEIGASMTVRLVRGVEMARMANIAGCDSLYVDREHSSFSLKTTAQICMGALGRGHPLGRVPEVATVSQVFDGTAFDGTALGVIAPRVRLAVATRIVAATAEAKEAQGDQVAGRLLTERWPPPATVAYDPNKSRDKCGR